jgi:putative ABC transport system permease protein
VFRQVIAVSSLSLRSIPQRAGPSIVVVVGIAAVVAVLVSVFTMAGSLTSSLIAVGSADRAIVLRT